MANELFQKMESVKRRTPADAARENETKANAVVFVWAIGFGSCNLDALAR